MREPPQSPQKPPTGAGDTLAALLARLCPWQPWDSEKARLTWLCRQVAVPAALLVPDPAPGSLPVVGREEE